MSLYVCVCSDSYCWVSERDDTCFVLLTFSVAIVVFIFFVMHKRCDFNNKKKSSVD
eukprot:m.76611 g.76611  ORF g.76611 m.76611 type:complete len:56 (+) comp11889_c0_seq6:1753-1920(+)